MRRKEVELKSREQTAAEIYELAESFKFDLEPYKNYSIEEFYNLVHSIPFVEDPEDEEIVSRPLYLLNPEYFPALDCKKKTQLLASFMELKGWDYVLIASAEHPEDPLEPVPIEPHHIFILLWTGDDWQPVDSTMPSDYLFKPKESKIILSDVMYR